MGSSEYEFGVYLNGGALFLLFICLFLQDFDGLQTFAILSLPMSTARVTRSSILGKRGHQQQVELPSSSSPSKSAGQLQTPDSTPLPKRPRVSLVLDGEGNKENVPPFSPRLLTPDPSPVASRTTRALRRSGTDIISSSRVRHGKIIFLLVFSLGTDTVGQKLNDARLYRPHRPSTQRLSLYSLLLLLPPHQYPSLCTSVLALSYVLHPTVLITRLPDVTPNARLFVIL